MEDRGNLGLEDGDMIFLFFILFGHTCKHATILT